MTHYNAAESVITLWLLTNTVYLRELHGQTPYDDSWLSTVNTDYYPKVKRDEAVGTYGTIYAYIYSDADRTSLSDTLSVALHEKRDFRYIYGINSLGADNNYVCTGYVKNLDLQEGEPTATVGQNLQPLLGVG